MRHCGRIQNCLLTPTLQEMPKMAYFPPYLAERQACVTHPRDHHLFMLYQQHFVFVISNLGSVPSVSSNPYPCDYQVVWTKNVNQLVAIKLEKSIELV